jgi:hypothetical protein
MYLNSPIYSADVVKCIDAFLEVPISKLDFYTNYKLTSTFDIYNLCRVNTSLKNSILLIKVLRKMQPYKIEVYYPLSDFIHNVYTVVKKYLPELAYEFIEYIKIQNYDGVRFLSYLSIRTQDTRLFYKILPYYPVKEFPYDTFLNYCTIDMFNFVVENYPDIYKYYLENRGKNCQQNTYALYLKNNKEVINYVLKYSIVTDIRNLDKESTLVYFLQHLYYADFTNLDSVVFYRDVTYEDLKITHLNGFLEKTSYENLKLVYYYVPKIFYYTMVKYSFKYYEVLLYHIVLNDDDRVLDFFIDYYKTVNYYYEKNTSIERKDYFHNIFENCIQIAEELPNHVSKISHFLNNITPTKLVDLKLTSKISMTKNNYKLFITHVSKLSLLRYLKNTIKDSKNKELFWIKLTQSRISRDELIDLVNERNNNFDILILLYYLKIITYTDLYNQLFYKHAHVNKYHFWYMSNVDKSDKFIDKAIPNTCDELRDVIMLAVYNKEKHDEFLNELVKFQLHRIRIGEVRKYIVNYGDVYLKESIIKYIENSILKKVKPYNSFIPQIKKIKFTLDEVEYLKYMLQDNRLPVDLFEAFKKYFGNFVVL